MDKANERKTHVVVSVLVLLTGVVILLLGLLALASTISSLGDARLVLAGRVAAIIATISMLLLGSFFIWGSRNLNKMLARRVFVVFYGLMASYIVVLAIRQSWPDIVMEIYPGLVLIELLGYGEKIKVKKWNERPCLLVKQNKNRG